MQSVRKARRAARLRQLVALEADKNGPGAQGRVAAEAGIPKSHMSHLMKGIKGIGDVIAARLEAMYGYPEGWFDWPFEDESSAETVSAGVLRMADRRRASIQDAIEVLALALRALDDDEREIAAMHLRAVARDPSSAAKRDAAIRFLERPRPDSAATRAASGGA